METEGGKERQETDREMGERSIKKGGGGGGWRKLGEGKKQRLNLNIDTSLLFDYSVSHHRLPN